MRLAAICLLLAAAAPSHDLQDNRVTLVLRDRTHLSITLYLNYPELLYRSLAPNQPYAAFLAAVSGAKPDALQKELTRLHSRFQAETRIRPAQPNPAQLTLSNWTWPDAKQVQAVIQRQIMQSLVDPEAHAHQPPTEIHADAVAPQPIGAVTAEFPAEFQKLLVVSYRPSQTWVEPGARSPEIRF